MGTTGAFSSLFDFLADFASSGFKFFTTIVDDSNEADMVEFMLMSWCISSNFVMVKSLFLLVVIKILKIPNLKRTDRV